VTELEERGGSLQGSSYPKGVTYGFGKKNMWCPWKKMVRAKEQGNIKGKRDAEGEKGRAATGDGQMNQRLVLAREAIHMNYGPAL